MTEDNQLYRENPSPFDPSEPVWVIGKNESILSYPDGFFEGKQTLGLNHASVIHNTTVASWIENMKDHYGTWKGDLVLMPYDPCYDKNHPREEGVLSPRHTMPWDHSPKAWEPAEFVKNAAKTRDPELRYSAWWSGCMHLAFWFLMENECRDVRLAGCNSSNNPMPGFEDQYSSPEKPWEQLWPDARRNTDFIIVEAAKYGFRIKLYEDYEDCCADTN